MQEKPPHPPQKVAIDRRRRPAREAPRRTPIMRQRGVRVVQVRDHHEPVCDEHPRHAVQRRDAQGAIAGAGEVEERAGEEEPEVGEEDGGALGGVEDD